MQSAVSAQNVIVATMNSRAQAEECLERLRQAGSPIGQLSVVGRDAPSEEKAAAMFWAAVRERLSAGAVLEVPRLGTMSVAGPIGQWMGAALKNEAVFAGLSPLGAALYSLGIPKDAAERYEAAVECGQILVIVHGAASQVEKARPILAAFTSL
jgi:hypothetical protein